jgi:3-hydroxyisobutyrate dehydrogenase
MTTSEPSLAVEIAREAARRGGAAVDAPVSGGDVGAREARLSIMIGGDPGPVSAVRPIFEILGKNVRHLGGPGAGQHTKMANQILISTTMIGMCESLVYGARAGLDLEDLISAIGKGAAACWSLDNYAPRILERDFDPGFFVEHFVKDMGIALREAARMRLSLPGLALARQLYASLMAKGKGRLGTQALALVLEDLCACEIGGER